MKPKFSDLITYINKALTGNDWNTNWQKIVNWLTLGTYDLKVNKIETNEIENSGTFTQNGNLIADNVQANTVTANSFVGDGSGLDNVRVTNTFPYTPFCVNSAKSNFIVNDTTKLTFLVDDGTLHQPLIVTTADGKQIKIISINDYDVSGLNGTYYIFVDEETNGGTVYLKTCEIFRQDTEPTGQNGDIWLDISNEPFVCREKVSNNWYSDTYNKVPIGKVVISGGTIDSLETLKFNDNGVNLFVVDSGISGYNWYRVWSNGFIEQGGRTDFSGSTITITYNIPFTSRDNTLIVTKSKNGNNLTDTWTPANNPVNIASYTTTGARVGTAGDYGTNVYCRWYACGY